jgi:hypothetical protein
MLYTMERLGKVLSSTGELLKSHHALYHQVVDFNVSTESEDDTGRAFVALGFTLRGGDWGPLRFTHWVRLDKGADMVKEMRDLYITIKWYTRKSPNERAEELLELAWNRHATHDKEMTGAEYLTCYDCRATYYTSYAFGGLAVHYEPHGTKPVDYISHPQDLMYGLPIDYRIYTETRGACAENVRWFAHFGNHASYFADGLVSKSYLDQQRDWLAGTLQEHFIDLYSIASISVRQAELRWAIQNDKPELEKALALKLSNR